MLLILVNLVKKMLNLVGTEFVNFNFDEKFFAPMKEVKNGIVSLRDPMQVLKELADVYNSLPDDSIEKAGIISDM